jgi:hypothetical protein
MSKFKMILLASVTVFAFCAVAASSAFAVEVPQWLVNGATIPLGMSFNVDVEPQEGSTLILLEDMKLSILGNPDILCEIEDALGWLLSNGLGEITTGTCGKAVDDNSLCATGTVTLEPANLPWTTEMLQTGTSFEIDLKSAGTGPGWVIKCTVAGMKIEDICTGQNNKALLVENTTDGLVLGEFMETIEKTEEVNCSLGGKEVGLMVGQFLLHALGPLAELLTLAFSLATEVP